MPAPTNISWDTATDLGTLPASVSQNVHDAGVTYTVWYKYTATDEDFVIGIWGFGGVVGGAYQPQCVPYTVPAGSPVAYPTGVGIDPAFNVPIYIEVESGTTYYFEFVASGSVASTLTIEALRSPNNLAPVGSIFVNDDTSPFPTAFVSSIDGDNYHTYQYRPLPAGEYGDVITTPDIKYLIENFAPSPNNLILYDSQFEELATVEFALGTGDVFVRTCLGLQKFYCGTRYTAGVLTQIAVVEADGTISATYSFNIGGAFQGVAALAAKNDGTLVYLAEQGVAKPIKVFNTATESFDANLVAAIANYSVQDMLMTSDDKLVVLYFKNSAPRALKAYIYNISTGATIATYDLEPGANFAQTSVVGSYRLAYAIDDPVSFWVWIHLHDGGTDFGRARYQNVRISDGIVIASVDHVEFDSGTYQLDETATPYARFGVSESCPFIIVREALAPYTPPEPPPPPPPESIGGIYELIPDKRNDTLWITHNPDTTEDVKIPDPTIRSALLGE